MVDQSSEDAAKAERTEEILSSLLPRLTRLSASTSRGRLLERAIEATGLPLDKPAITILVTLNRASGPLRVGEIAAQMQVVGPHVTRHVGTLEKRGLVRRVTDPDDQRARLIELTDSGTAAAEAYTRSVFTWFAEVLADWPEQDRLDLVRLLGRLTDDVTAHLETLDEN
ncbi:MarR family winged helix-turn-helix transcriptional regulator [Streptomyces sp. CA-111067]|uniref:MarR family winged helix-turn-helix transcriptional regulator n=1 Tax=Streptomyces sp. CA-111067 TaxID=3240046 RepID=UPI003D96B730